MQHLISDRKQAKGRAGLVVAVVAGMLALAVRWYFVTHAQVMQPIDEAKHWGDASDYYRYAWHLFHQGLFSGDPAGAANARADSFRDPGYPAFLALCMMMTDTTGQWYGIVLLSQAVLGGMTVTFATLAIRNLVPTWLLATAALTMALWPHLVAIPAYVLSENLTAPLWALAALAFGEAAGRQSLTYTVIGAIALAGAALTAAVLGPLVVLFGLVFAWKRTMPRRQIVVLMIVAAIPLLAWGIRNSTLPSDTWSSSFRAEINLVQGSWPTYHAASRLNALRDPVGIETTQAIHDEVLTLHSNRMQGLRMMIDRMRHAPGTYLAWYLSKPALLWGWEIGIGSGDIYVYPTRNSPFMTNPLLKAVEAIAFIFNGVLALLAFIGLIMIAMRQAPPAAMLVFAAAAAWITVVYGVLQSDPRYAIPFRTGEIALACAAVTAAVSYRRRRADVESEK